ncbi:hypothetical protein H6P81_003895 [Aristolochia fimbriata]|uniref:Fe2OG dioxygenase domain-containing protein n=1 Tax=Aristolochia fimbriata TaxID=158543 RepID=A0AAV7FGV1_ARIFI|nr:hypothetical protein H6P81_003895 [Aristolochia fimbriata]
MDTDSIPDFPVIVLFDEAKASERGSREWDTLSKRVREAGENWGCFEVVYHELPAQLRSEAFSALKPLFELPPETKAKNNNPKPYHAYAIVGPYEGFGIEDASNMESVQHFSELMWLSRGNIQFCQTITALVKHVEKLISILETMIMDSYGLVDQKFCECSSLLRVMTYSTQPTGDEFPIQLHAHTDKPLLTILCEDQVSGLEVLSKEGTWIPVSLSSNSFFFLVGDPLMAWSNGRLHAVKHRVVLKGGKERLSWCVFAVPKEGETIKTPEELVDEEHPLVFKEFDYNAFLNFSMSKEAQVIDSALQVYAHAGLTTLKY